MAHIPEHIAARAAALGDLGYPSTQVATMTGLSQRCVYNIIHGIKHWGTVAAKPTFIKQRLEQKQVLQAASLAVSARALVQVEEQIHKASAYQAAGIYGLLRTHERLDAGESIANLSVHTEVDLKGIDMIAELLAQSLLAAGQGPGDPSALGGAVGQKGPIGIGQEGPIGHNPSQSSPDPISLDSKSRATDGLTSGNDKADGGLGEVGTVRFRR